MHVFVCPYIHNAYISFLYVFYVLYVFNRPTSILTAIISLVVSSISSWSMTSPVTWVLFSVTWFEEWLRKLIRFPFLILFSWFFFIMLSSGFSSLDSMTSMDAFLWLAAFLEARDCNVAKFAFRYQKYSFQ